MSGFRKIVVTTLIIASVSIGIGAYILFESGLGAGEIGDEVKNLFGGNEININLGSGVEVMEEYTYSVENKEMILLETRIGDVEVNGYDGDEIKLLVEGRVPERYLDKFLKVEDSEEALKIYVYKEIKNLTFTLGSTYDLDIELLVPKDYLNNMQVENISGEITMDGINANNLSIESVSGDIVLEEGKYNKVDFRTISGQFISYSPVNFLEGESVSGKITATDVKESFMLETVSGNVNLSAINLKRDAEVSTISGSVNIEIEDLLELSYDLSSISGKITVDTQEEIYQSSQSLERKVNNSVKLSVTTVSGKINVKY